MPSGRRYQHSIYRALRAPLVPQSMVDRVAYHVNQWVTNLINDCFIEFGFIPFRDQFYMLAALFRRVCTTRFNF